ncbi:Protein of unknown function [Roseovarius azorensis]|uniref:DUF1403 family protein n=1 Tax=Roseovarius azorensis TaxID=1287727 RepID=A0A1H7WX99_9RHOB|nr:DUF1403 family protein [Roseovarius azorensis]SEM26250.1 Protein of unknown function [Roseovarius azorensis]
MTYQSTAISDDPVTLPKLPGWVTSERAKTPEDVAFMSGAALSHQHLVLGHDAVPQVLLRARLALRAAERCVANTGRSERAAELRDAVGFLQPGDSPGPAGEITLSWQRAVERPVSVSTLNRALPALDPEAIATWLDMGQGAPVARASTVLEAVLEDRPRDQTAALLLTEAALAQALGWSYVLPLLSMGLKRGDLRKTGAELRFACHLAIGTAAVEATRETNDLSRRAARLRAIAPKLRAKGAEEAVAVFLTHDAVAPTALTSLRSDRAARRFCDRLVALGAVRELTGRDTFRLYGI